jgi:TatD DNase family protein
VLIDTHCHLEESRFAGGVQTVIQRARASGVTGFVDVGVGSNDRSLAAVTLAKRVGAVAAAVGIDPHEAASADDGRWQVVEELAQDSVVVAIGETGLDYFYRDSPESVQRQVFARQVALARHVRKPLIIHTREALNDTVELLKREGASAVGGVFHCFSGDVDFARAVLDLGFFISFSGLLTFVSDEALSEAARFVPADRIVVETDSPYLSPAPVRKCRPCEPSFVVHTARHLAELRRTDFEELCEQTTCNARRLFAFQFAADGVQPPAID